MKPPFYFPQGFLCSFGEGRRNKEKKEKRSEKFEKKGVKDE